MEKIQDYPSIYEYVGDGTTKSFLIPSNIIDITYVKVIINGVILNSNNYTIANNAIVFLVAPKLFDIIKVKIASSGLGKLQLDFETSQAIVLDGMLKMNSIVKEISGIVLVNNNKVSLIHLESRLSNVVAVYLNLMNIKNVADNVQFLGDPDIKNHSTTSNRNTPDSHSIGSITGLQEALDSIMLLGVFPTKLSNNKQHNTQVLCRQEGVLKVLEVDALITRRFKETPMLNPYFKSGLILKDIYDTMPNGSPIFNSSITNIDNQPLILDINKERRLEALPFEDAGSYVHSSGNIVGTSRYKTDVTTTDSIYTEIISKGVYSSVAINVRDNEVGTYYFIYFTKKNRTGCWFSKLKIDENNVLKLVSYKKLDKYYGDTGDSYSTVSFSRALIDYEAGTLLEGTMKSQSSYAGGFLEYQGDKLVRSTYTYKNIVLPVGSAGTESGFITETIGRTGGLTGFPATNVFYDKKALAYNRFSEDKLDKVICELELDMCLKAYLGLSIFSSGISHQTYSGGAFRLKGDIHYAFSYTLNSDIIDRVHILIINCRTGVVVKHISNFYITKAPLSGLEVFVLFEDIRGYNYLSINEKGPLYCYETDKFIIHPNGPYYTPTHKNPIFNPVLLDYKYRTINNGYLMGLPYFEENNI